MQKIDLHKAINAISDVVINRPPAIRAFDQIYMKFGDMLIQAELISRWFKDKKVVFIGDGDAIALCLMHLKEKKIFDVGPNQVLVLDFDERVVNAINNFASRNHLKDKISALSYNIANPLPKHLWSKFDAFYTNPPFGSSNDGQSLKAFINRGIEACHSKAVGCIIAADSPDLDWPVQILYSIEEMLIGKGFAINSMNHNLHQYHLDDNPDLTSCNLFVRRISKKNSHYNSLPLSSQILKHFYGKNNPLRYEHIKDLTNGGKLQSKDYKFIKLKRG
jgi:predicted methyltransferase